MKQKHLGSNVSTSFGTFLQTMQKRGVEAAPPRDVSMDVLRILQSHACTVPELLKDVKEEPDRVITLLNGMVQTGLITLTGDEEKIAKLTVSGKLVIENYNANGD